MWTTFKGMCVYMPSTPQSQKLTSRTVCSGLMASADIYKFTNLTGFGLLRDIGVAQGWTSIGLWISNRATNSAPWISPSVFVPYNTGSWLTTWVWFDGQPFNFFPTDTPSLWAAGEPNDSGGNGQESCGEVFSYGLNDISCGTNYLACTMGCGTYAGATYCKNGGTCVDNGCGVSVTCICMPHFLAADCSIPTVGV